MKAINLSKKPIKLKEAVIVLGIVLLIAAAAAPAYYFYSKYQKTQQLINNPTQAAVEEVNQIKDRVDKLIDLPKDEEPTLATVSDKNKLKDQPFFSKAENGDKVLIYTQAKKAILYRPGINKVIEMTSINLGSNELSQPATASAKLQQVKIVLRNGANINGLTNKVEAEVKKALQEAQIIKKENAARFNYEKTIVVPLTNDVKEVSASLANALKATLGELPPGESKPADANILIILGKDRL